MKKHRNNSSILVLILAAAYILASCGSSSSGASSSTSSPARSSTGGGSSASFDMAENTTAPQAPPYELQYKYKEDSVADGFSSGGSTASAQAAIPADRKIIRNASLEIKAQDASALYKAIVSYGTEIGGYENSYSITNYEAYSVIHAEFKVPPESLGIFVDFVGESGEIINSSMASDDITESYFDATTRLDTKRKSLERYYELMANAPGIEEIVYIQQIIDGITEDIEALEGRLKVWNSLANMATVSLYIRQDNDPVQIRKEINWNTLSMDDMGYLIKRGFYSVTNTIVSILQWLVVLLVGYSPIWILLAVGVILWVVTRKKRASKRASASDDKND